MRNTLFKLNSSKIFQFSVIFIIILNAITVGISTYDLNPIIKNSIQLLDYGITVFFVIEMLLRILFLRIISIIETRSGEKIFETPK